MDPITFAMPQLLIAAIVFATLHHWHMRAHGMPVRAFASCSSEWRSLGLRRAVACIMTLP